MRYLIAAISFYLCIGAAGAQTTSLTLAVTGTSVVQPDQIVASLTVQTNAASAAAAQAALNRAMEKALVEARQTALVDAVTGGYNVNETDPQTASAKTQFQASQELDLTIPAPGGNPPASFTALVGDLQGQGLLLQSIGGSLSAKGGDAARAAATVDGIHRLQAQAQAVAQSLGDVVGSITSLNLNNNDSGPTPMRPMLAMAAAPPPQLAPGPITVTVNLDATIALKPPGA